MEAQPKIVMQVTISAEECPELHRELLGMTAARRRAKRLPALASVGLLVEQGRLVGAATSSRPRSAAHLDVAEAAGAGRFRTAADAKGSSSARALPR